jgi:hypothetical protein
VLDEFAARLDDVARQLGKDVVGLIDLLDRWRCTDAKLQPAFVTASPTRSWIGVSPSLLRDRIGLFKGTSSSNRSTDWSHDRPFSGNGAHLKAANYSYFEGLRLPYGNRPQ